MKKIVAEEINQARNIYLNITSTGLEKPNQFAYKSYFSKL